MKNNIKHFVLTSEYSLVDSVSSQHVKFLLKQDLKEEVLTVK